MSSFVTFIVVAVVGVADTIFRVWMMIELLPAKHYGLSYIDLLVRTLIVTCVASNVPG